MPAFKNIARISTMACGGKPMAEFTLVKDAVHVVAAMFSMTCKMQKR